MLQLTKTFMRCNLCPVDFGNGDGLLEDVIPRGWAGSAASGPRPILVASLNPSHPPDAEIQALTRAGLHPRRTTTMDVTDAAAAEVLRISTAFYDSSARTRDQIFARKVLGYVRAAAWLLRRANAAFTLDPRDAPWPSLAWITDVYKCSTRRDSGPLIPDALREQCVETHLRREIAACTPKVVLALGGDAAKTLAACGIAHHHLRHGANGCAALDDAEHDESFAGVAVALGLDRAVAASDEFVAFRYLVQKDYFPSSLPARRSHRLAARGAPGTGVTRPRLIELIHEAHLEVVQLKSWPRVDGVAARMLSFGNDANIRDIHLRRYRIAHPLCEPISADEARQRGWASVRGRIRPRGAPTALVEDAVRLALRALADVSVGEQVE